MSLESFLPYYPSIDDEKEFNDQLHRKKEFYDHRLSEGLPELTDTGYLQHQLIIARFLSPHTIYPSLFLFHEAGSGKTAATIGVCEEFFKSQSRINKALIIVSNTLLEKRFLNEIVNIGGPQYEPDSEGIELEDPKEREQLLLQRARKKVNQRYQLQTYNKFMSQYLSKSTAESWRQQYSNHIIIFDEVHKIAGNEESKVYDKYHGFFHAVNNSKIILMSGTPMRNDAIEFGRIMNLILPLTLQYPTTSSAFNEMMTTPAFTERLIGRVSYLKTQTTIPKEYVGQTIDPVKQFTLYPGVMSNYQLEAYKATFEQDSGWRNASRLVSLYTGPTSSKIDFMRQFAGLNAQEKIQHLSTFSIKYARAVATIVNNRKQNTFVFTSFIEPPGAVIFGWCLELFGFKNTLTGTETSPGLRYAILSETGTMRPDITTIIQQFNRQRNKHGKYIRVLIGGMKVSVGVTFKNLQQIHIMTPTWNYSVIDQAIARGIRFQSHSGLPENTPVRIFLHVSVHPTLTWRETVDLIMYETAQEKDVSIKYVEYLAKTHAIDCALTYNRNIDANGDDYSRECEYQMCKYDCFGVPITGPANDPYRLRLSELDQTTYDLYYSTDDVGLFRSRIQELFDVDSEVSLLETYRYVRRDYSLNLFLRLLHALVAQKIPMKNRYGFTAYLQYSQGMVFLVQDGVRDTHLSDAFYSEYSPARIVSDTMFEVQAVVRDYIVHEMEEVRFEQQKKLIFKQLGVDVQDEFVKELIKSEVEFKEDNTPNDFGQWLLQRNESKIEYRSGEIRYKSYVLDTTTMTWTKNPEREVGARGSVAMDVVQSFLGVYGLISNDGRMNIVDNRAQPVSARRITSRGQSCNTIRKDVLISIGSRLGLDLQDVKLRKDMCEQIQTRLDTMNLLFSDVL